MSLTKKSVCVGHLFPAARKRSILMRPKSSGVSFTSEQTQRAPFISIPLYMKEVECMSSFVFEAPIAVLCLIRKGKAPLELQISFDMGAHKKAPRQQEVRELLQPSKHEA